jgi:twitching motility protein PilT
VHEILLQHEALPNTIRSGRISDIKSIIEGGGADGMITMDVSLMNRIKDGTIEPKEAYMKAAVKAPFAALLKPGDLDGGH